MSLASLNGLPIAAADPNVNYIDPLHSPDSCVAPTYGTEVRVTGALILDCGHSDLTDSDTSYATPTDAIHNCDQREGADLVCAVPSGASQPQCRYDVGGEDQNQEIHPFYSYDLIECPLGNYPSDACPDKTVRANLTGAWGSEDGGTYYIRQMGNTIWWLGLTRNRDPIMPDATGSATVTPIANPTNVFKGTITRNTDGTAVISGQAITVPKGLESGGVVTDATFTVKANNKHFDLAPSTSSAFPFPTHFDKLYEPQEDTTAPVSSIAVGNPKFQASSTSPLYVNSSTPFTVKATDNVVNGDITTTGSGVQTVWYRFYPVGTTPPAFKPIVLDRPRADAQESFTIGGLDGAYEVDTYASDASGNDESPHSVVVTLDNTPPSVGITQPTAANYTHADIVTISYTVSDGNGSGVRSNSATLNGSGVTNGQVVYLLYAPLGPNTFTVTAADNLGNTAATSVLFHIIVTPLSIEADVKEFVKLGRIDTTLQTPLLATLQAAANSWSSENCTAATQQYRAFVNQVRAQTGQGIDPTAANILTGDANYLIANCP